MVQTRKHRQSFRKQSRKQLGGARDELTSLLPAEYEKFDWGLYYISAHGFLSQEMFEVPANTYILNLATTGNICSVKNTAIEALMFADGDTPDDIERKRQEIFKKLQTGITANAAEGVEKLYTRGDIRKNIEELYSGTNTGKKTLAIYEPGDYMFDCHFLFRNQGFPMFLMGVYEAPMPQRIWQTMIDNNRMVWKKGERPTPKNYNLENINASRIPKGRDMLTALDSGDSNFNMEENLARDIMFPGGGVVSVPSYYNMALMSGLKPHEVPFSAYTSEEFHRVLSSGKSPMPFPNRPELHLHPNSAPFLRPGPKLPTLYDTVRQLNHRDGRVKLIIVHTCRRIDEKLMPTNFRPALVRRYSIATRIRPAPTEEKKDRLRSQLRADYLDRIHAALSRKLTNATIPAKKREEIANVVRKIETLRGKPIFDFRELRTVMRDIVALKVIGIQDEFISLLQLSEPLPPGPRNFNEGNWLEGLLKEYERKQKLAQLEAFDTQVRETKEIMKGRLTSEQMPKYNAFFDRFITMVALSFPEFPPLRTREDAETLYWNFIVQRKMGLGGERMKPLFGRMATMLAGITKSVGTRDVGFEITLDGLQLV